MQSFKRLTGVLVVALGLAFSFPAAASAAPTPFGSDLSAEPFGVAVPNVTLISRAGGSGATPAGYVAPAAGIITGWRIKSANGPGPNSLLRFQIVRGNTSIYLGPTVDIGTTNGISATFPESVLVKQGDKIGITNETAANSRNISGSALGSKSEIWAPRLGASDTRAPDGTVDGFVVLIQADLDANASVCGGAQATIAGTSGSDVITGTAGNDVIVGLGGDDVVRGLGGDDVICGGDGNDKLKGGLGRDQLLGEAGRDKLNGGGSKDRCFGGADKDAIGCEKAKQN